MPFEFKYIGPRAYVKGIVYLQIRASNATSGPPIGPALGQCGIPAAPFCKEFNDRTLIFKSNVILFVTLYLHITGEYNFDIRLPSTSFFLMRAVKMRRGLKKPGFIFSDLQELRRRRVYSRFKYITPYLIYELFLYRVCHYGLSLTYGYSFCRKALGTLRSIGILVFNL